MEASNLRPPLLAYTYALNKTRNSQNQSQVANACTHRLFDLQSKNLHKMEASNPRPPLLAHIYALNKTSQSQEQTNIRITF